MATKKIFLGIIGGSSCTKEVGQLAYDVGKEIAKAKAILLCGGLGGTMEAACRGAKSENGTTIGILPSWNRHSANQYVDYAIVTGLSEMRNLLVVENSDAIIALPGRYGTLSEIAFCLNSGKPIISFSNWNISKKMIKPENPAEAVKLALEKIGNGR